MALVTALTVIKGAMLRVGVLDPIETPTAEQSAVCLDALNGLLDGLQTSGLGTVNNQEVVASMVGGAQTLTIGPLQQIDIPRPVEVVGVYCRLMSLDHPADIISKEMWDSIDYKSLGASWPTVCWYDGGIPTGALHFWPIPAQTTEVHVTVNAALQPYAAVTASQLMPQGLQRALTLSLAVEIAPIFGLQPSPLLLRDASNSMRVYKRTRAEVPQLDQPRRMTRLGGFLSGL
jgi:hypothetical protein